MLKKRRLFTEMGVILIPETMVKKSIKNVPKIKIKYYLCLSDNFLSS